jgi:hypothetical protein
MSSHAIRGAATAGFNAYPELVPTVAWAGAEITALDVVESTHKNVVVAITCNTSGDEHGSGSSLPSMCLAAVAEGVITASDSGRVVHSAHLIHPRKAHSGCLSN